MTRLLHFLLVTTAIFAAPAGNEFTANLDGLPLGKGVDVHSPTTSSNIDCLRSNQFKIIFVRAYCPCEQGQVDKNGVSTIRNAIGKLGIEIYMSPMPTSPKSGAVQFNEMYTNLASSGIRVSRAWIQVLNNQGAVWSSNIAQNRLFIRNILDSQRIMGVNSAILTSQNDWQVITGNWNFYGDVPQPVILWNQNITSLGPQGATSPCFCGFKPYGPWNIATINRYVVGVGVCGMINVGVNTFPVSPTSVNLELAHSEKSGMIIVGNNDF